MGGALWAWWPAYERFFAEVCDLTLPGDLSERGRAYAETTRSIGYWWPNKSFCIVCDRPAKIARDERGALHCENGASIKWRDGWSLYHWHGIRVPSEWIEDRARLTPEIALEQTNAELRRAACEIIGWDKLLSKLDARTIDKDADPMIGELVEVTLEGQQEKFLRMLCGTGRWFAEPVPPEMKTALEANAWGYGYKVKEFHKPEIRT